MALRRRKLAEFRPQEGNDNRGTDTCDIEHELCCEDPKQKQSALAGRDFQWAEAAIEWGGRRKGAFYVYKWGTGFVDDKDYVDICSHGRLLVSVRRLGHGDGMIMIGTTDIKNILLAINEKEKFRGQGNAMKRLPIFLGTMTYLGPNECDVDLEWFVWLNECCGYSRTFASRGEMSEIDVQE